MGMKKGLFFTIDSLLASGIIIIAILLVSNFYSKETQTVNVNYASQDLVRVFSAMTVGEADNDYVKSLISNGAITNANNTILESIAYHERNISLKRSFIIIGHKFMNKRNTQVTYLLEMEFQWIFVVVI